MQQLEMPLLTGFSSSDESKAKRKLGLVPDIELLKGLSEEEKSQWIDYLYANPKPETKKLSLRNHIIGLYDPFAARKDFPAGRRWCVNVYTGCAFLVNIVIRLAIYEMHLSRELKGILNAYWQMIWKKSRKLYLHAAPIHISNSTDPLQPLEKVHKHTLLLLQKLLEYRDCFTTITILTKNPILLCAPEYSRVIKAMQRFQVEVTCPFYTDKPRQLLEPGAPKIETRLEGIKQLRDQDITVALRIDPIFPRDPLPHEFFDKRSLKDYGAPQSQTEEDIETFDCICEKRWLFQNYCLSIKTNDSAIQRIRITPVISETICGSQ